MTSLTDPIANNPTVSPEEVFVEVFECEHGRVGVCLGCGEEKLIPFSREVAA
jgi:hypothetical protein